ncbi:CapA family protein [Trueperella bialowiezensis]|uniref:Bacterial capsule synthesis protein PGA_cap n=1 Tax=Trueperella bialowiezensis TaxID=312285 RepID=A0A3S4VSA1_9ACTO|nr:CapA family protein [Trueperella bialowiezensis]VEI12632.1 Bacterial capsule synthesis protein PGA_cap [Trueperella bialowiezensis]
MKTRMGAAVFVVAAIIAAAVTLGFIHFGTADRDLAASHSPSATPTVTASPNVPTPSPTPSAPPERFTVVSGGDILLHLSVNESARIRGENYDYTPLYQDIQPFIANADVALCALETPIVGSDEMPSNYPLFGAPWDLAASLAQIGFDGCALATNHTMDRGFGGVNTTIEALSQAGLGWAGSARTQDEADQIQFYHVQGEHQQVTIAHLSATTLTNGIPIPADHPYSWNVVGDLGQPVSTVIERAKEARERGGDIVIVSMHWGTEYVNEPIDEQVEITRELAESGVVDLVFGNHSHVPQPLERVAGGPDGQGMWVVYSMGNQISGQTVESHGPRVTTGLMTTATIEVRGEGDAAVTDFDYTVVTQDRAAGERLRPLTPLVAGDYPADLGLSAYQINSRADVTYPVLESSGPERTEPPTPTGATVTPSRR